MIKLTFNNWTISARATAPVMRGDDGTVDVVVSGIPAGWEWELLIRRNGADVLTTPMVEQDGALATTLTAEQLAYDGYYTMQLKATQGEMVKHSGAVNVKIGSTISGDDHWPEIPTAFSQAIARAEAAIADAQEVQDAVEQSETAAAQSASDAAQSATEAAGSATASSASATDAAGSAAGASQSATSAAASATAAAAAVTHYPRISTTTGNWEVWDAATGTWTDTGVRAESPVQDVTIDGQSVLTGGTATVNSASVTKNGMTGNSPAWTPAEQFTARQRLGIDETMLGDVTLTEEANSVLFELEPDDFINKYKSLSLYVELPKIDGATTANATLEIAYKRSGEIKYSSMFVSQGASGRLSNLGTYAHHIVYNVKISKKNISTAQIFDEYNSRGYPQQVWASVISRVDEIDSSSVGINFHITRALPVGTMLVLCGEVQ